jgi:hypothetical protein
VTPWFLKISLAKTQRREERLIDKTDPHPALAEPRGQGKTFPDIAFFAP